MKREQQLFSAAAAVLFLGLASPLPASAHEAAHGGPRQARQRCTSRSSATPRRKEEFDLAMAYYHSFAWHLRGAARTGAQGRSDVRHGALGARAGDSRQPVHLAWHPVAEEVERRSGGARAARKTGLKSQRERDYVEALAVFLKDHDKVNHRTRAQAFEAAMARSGKPLSRGSGGVDSLCAHPVGELRSDRQEIHQSAQGGGRSSSRYSNSSRSIPASRIT